MTPQAPWATKRRKKWQLQTPTQVFREESNIHSETSFKGTEGLSSFHR